MGPSQSTRPRREDAKSVKHIQPKLFRKFSVQKSTAMGLLFPQNLQLEVRNLDRHDQDLGPVYQTSPMGYLAQTVYIPPPFKLYRADSNAIVGLHHTIDEQAISEMRPPKMNWLTMTIANIEMFKTDDGFQYDHALPSDIRKKWTIKQKGFKRVYEMTATDDNKDETQHSFIWKNSAHVLNLIDDTSPICRGNMKLLSSDGTIIAAWKQRRDCLLLGSIHIFEEARDLLPVEVIVVSALCLAIQQKIWGTTWLGRK